EDPQVTTTSDAQQVQERLDCVPEGEGTSATVDHSRYKEDADEGQQYPVPLKIDETPDYRSNERQQRGAAQYASYRALTEDCLCAFRTPRSDRGRVTGQASNQDSRHK